MIGEAASRLPIKFREKYAEIPWRQIVGLRNRVVHDYFGVDLDIVWMIIQNDLPAFRSRLGGIRQELKGKEE